MKNCVKWFLVVGILFCLFGTGIITAGARNAKSYLREYYHHAEEIEEHVDDYIEY